MTKFHCLVAFTLRDIEQYVYCDCLLETIFLKCKSPTLNRGFQISK